MQTDVHIRYQEALNMSHHRRLTIIKTIFTGNCGHPHISINPDFLHWAYSHRTVSGITCFLGIHRDMVRSALLEHGIVKPQENPFQSHLEEPVVDVPPLEDDELLDPHFTLPNTLLSDIQPPGPLTTSNGTSVGPSVFDVTSYTRPLSGISDADLDDLVIQVCWHFQCAGISMLDGMLHRLGHKIPHECIDPVQQVFQCIKIWQWTYSVASPMVLWHNDRQHGNVYLHF